MTVYPNLFVAWSGSRDLLNQCNDEECQKDLLQIVVKRNEGEMLKKCKDLRKLRF